MANEKLKFHLPDAEEKVLAFWDRQKIFEKTLAKTLPGRQAGKRGKTFVFYEGPPTANGLPHIGHALTRAFKDIILRYKTMRGFFVPRIAGWDTHGLPVEIEVEKQLGIKSKPEIEKYGIARFNQKAKESVWRYKDEWEKATKRLGFWLDMQNPYVTYQTPYIETLWWIIKEIWKKGLLYRDFKSVPWCPRCGTGLSSHEVGLGYKKVKDTSVFVKLKIKNKKNEYLLIWTTTPWTLPANVAVALNPKLEYTKFKVAGEHIWSLRTPPARAGGPADAGQNISVVEKISGKALLGQEYEPLYHVPAEYSLGKKPPYKVLPADFVSGEDGTGMVHIASAFGEDDLNLMKSQYADSPDYPILQTVNPDGTMKKGVIAPGKFVKDADPIIIEDLKNRGLLVKTERYEHDYPFCWRCDTPLLYFARSAWWVKTTAVKEKLLKNNAGINWIPGHLKDGRFGEFLKELRDWAFSRERYWGTPLPVWVCEKCSEEEAIGSIEELTRKLGAGLLPRDEKGEINLHRPYVDDLQWPCRKCKGAMKRVTEVVDVWFDSGAMPYASVHYPFSLAKNPKSKIQNPKLLFPADYICEAIDQTRGWFYTLLAVSTLLGRGTPYKNVISLGHVLDKNGQKMSKSKGNVVDPQDIIQKYGTDTLRWYLYTVNPPGEPKRFDEKDLAQKLRGFLMIFWNSFMLFDTYADKIPSSKSQNPNKFQIPKSKNVLDKWVLIKLDLLALDVTQKLDAYDITGAGRAIEDFVVSDFSQWYLRRSRRRLQHPVSPQEKTEAAETTAFVLLSLCKLLAPFTPFLSEAIYQELRKKMKLKELSIHLMDWPKLESGIRNQESGILKDMEEVRKIVGEALRLRAEAGVKVRQPLARLQITNDKLRKEKELLQLIKDEVNVKEIAFGSDLKLDTQITPELKEEGFVREFIRNIQEMRRDAGLKPGQLIRIQVLGDRGLEEVISKWEAVIKRDTYTRKIKIGGKKEFSVERELEFDEVGLWVGIDKV